MKIRIIAILISLSLVVGFSGCSGLNLDELTNQLTDGITEVVDQVMPTPSQEELLQEAERNRTAKHNAYVGMSNFMNDRFTNSLERYFDTFGMDEKLNSKKPSSPYSMSDYYIEMVQEALDFASQEPVFKELDPVVKELAPSVLEIMETINLVMDYYDQKNYVDDKFEKGQEYHTKLLELVEKIDETWYTFDDLIDELVRASQEKDLIILKDEGRMIQYYALETIVNAKAISGFLYDNEIDSSNIHKADLEAYAPYYEALSASALSFLEAAKNEEYKENESYFFEVGTSIWFGNLEDALAELKAASSSMYEAIEKGKKLSSSSSTGSPSKFYDAFSDLIENYNKVIS